MTFDDAWTEPKTPDPDPQHIKVLHAYHEVFTSLAGQVVLGDLEKYVQQRSSFSPGQPDVTAFREGERSVYLRIVAMLEEASTPQPQTAEEP